MTERKIFGKLNVDVGLPHQKCEASALALKMHFGMVFLSLQRERQVEAAHFIQLIATFQ